LNQTNQLLQLPTFICSKKVFKIQILTLWDWAEDVCFYSLIGGALFAE